MPTNRPTLSMREILDAARQHQRDITDLVQRLEYICGVSTAPLSRTAPAVRRAAQTSAHAARKVAAATAMFHAATNGHAPAGTATTAKGKRRRKNTPPGVAGDAIIAALKGHPRSSLSELAQRIDPKVWAPTPANISMALHTMKAQRLIRADKATAKERKANSSVRFVYSIAARVAKRAPTKATRPRRESEPKAAEV